MGSLLEPACRVFARDMVQYLRPALNGSVEILSLCDVGQISTWGDLHDSNGYDDVTTPFIMASTIFSTIIKLTVLL